MVLAIGFSVVYRLARQKVLGVILALWLCWAIAIALLGSQLGGPV